MAGLKKKVEFKSSLEKSFESLQQKYQAKVDELEKVTDDNLYQLCAEDFWHNRADERGGRGPLRSGDCLPETGLQGERGQAADLNPGPVAHHGFVL